MCVRAREADAPDEIEMLIASLVRPDGMTDGLFERYSSAARETLRSTACVASDLFLINYHLLAGKFLGGEACAGDLS